MNIGVFFRQSNQPAVTTILYPIFQGSAEVIKGGVDEFQFPRPREFKIQDNGINFHFSTEIEDLMYCDIRLLCDSTRNFQESTFERYQGIIDYYLLSVMEGESLTGQEQRDCPKWLNERDDVVIFCGHRWTVIEDHPRAITDRAINIFYFYNAHGYYYLNFYPMQDKRHLVGVYNKYDNYKTFRKKLLDLFSDYADQEIHKFNIEHTFYTDVGGKILDPWAWQSQHITSYLDFNTAVANIVFETQVGDHPEDMLTEKTMKSIIFQRADIFIIYCGTARGLDWLHSKGFWFLNSEFYEPDNFENVPDFPGNLRNNQEIAIPVYRSVYKAVDYLKKLKDEYGSNNEVYKVLIDKYRLKLDQNVTALENLMTNCEYKQKLFDIITRKPAK